MKLDGAQRQQLHQALLSAFPTWPALEQMVSFGLDTELAKIAGTANLSQAVFDLLTWAEAGNRFQDLLNAAGQANPSNALLKSFAESQGVLTTQAGPYLVPAQPLQGVFGREKDLTEIASLLALDDDKATNVPPLALRGMGGIGKTTLVVAVGRREGIRQQFPDGVLWVALGPEPVIRVLQNNLGRALGVDLLPERDETTCRDRLRAVLEHRQVLLIVDDVWNEKQGSYFQIGGARCRTLFTTREPPIAYALATRGRTREVGVLSMEASLALLMQLAPQVEESLARQLCERLEYLPLALNLAGRLLAKEDVPSRISRFISELMERREARLKLLQNEGRLGSGEENPVSIQAILGMSVERLDKTDQERFAMSSVFGGEPLTWEINAATRVWECSLAEAEATTTRFIQRGLVEPRPEERYWMHALLADYAAEMAEELGL